MDIKTILKSEIAGPKISESGISNTIKKKYILANLVMSVPIICSSNMSLDD